MYNDDVYITAIHCLYITYKSYSLYYISLAYHLRHCASMTLCVNYCRSLAVKLPTIWTDGKAEAGRVREKVREKVEKSRAKAVPRSSFLAPIFWMTRLFTAFGDIGQKT